eukprot:NODE_126_length_17250_cov_2.558743.p15 type:complete len:143 gc:universal NODE_126_length_17250_cov_2.558743:1706-1278(-)
MLYFNLSELQLENLSKLANTTELNELKLYEHRVPISLVLQIAEDISPFISRIDSDKPKYPKSKFLNLRTPPEDNYLEDKPMFIGIGNCGFTAASVFLASWYATGTMDVPFKVLTSLLLCLLVLFAELFLFFRHIQQLETSNK